MVTRPDSRSPDELRPVEFRTAFQRSPAGSVAIACGDTRVLCAVTAVEGVPRWMRNDDPRGWVTAEYRMLPGATPDRARRESGASPSGRSSEIQRLIGRSLRAAVDLTRLPGLTLFVDCDVLDADGGTRCAAITGACVALELACHALFEAGTIRDWPLEQRVSAVSVGLTKGAAVLDLNYAEDSNAEVDMNVVMAADGRFIEVQGTGENGTFSRAQMDAMLELACQGCAALSELQKAAVLAAVRGRQSPNC